MAKTNKDEKPLEAYQTVRFHEGPLYFGFKLTQLRKKIAEGTIPPPFKLSDSGRALGWLGQQIIDYHQQRMAAADAHGTKSKVRT